jgi:hypothetical protein
MKTVASPANSDVRDSGRRNETAAMHNSPSASSRADAGGHLSRFIGKGVISPKLLRRDDGDLSLQHQGTQNFTNFPSGAEPPAPPLPMHGDNRFKR